ncbi:hypothetical protein DRN67_02620 [Candidatus Micrarchaeota archaeon]|nr:MAG: hypothetical protein DRN67_02620 [Candidatus Micrarchaeota archaeon]
MSNFSNCRKAFYEELEFRIHPDVYEPSEDSFALARQIGKKEGGSVLDVGTGCGILAVIAAARGAEVVGVDVSIIAIENAEFNAESNGVECRFKKSNLFERVGGKFDLIMFNPPYLPTAPEEIVKGPLNHAFNGGADGREVIQRFCSSAGEYLKRNGRILMVASSLSGIEKSIEELHKAGLNCTLLEEIPMFQERLAVIEARVVDENENTGSSG